MNALIKKTAFTQIIKYKSYVYRFQEVQVFYYFSCLDILSYFHKISLFQGYNIFFFVWPGTILFQSFFLCVSFFLVSLSSVLKKNRVTHKCKSLSLEFTPLTVHKIRNSWKYSFFVCDYCVTAACIVLCISFQFTSYTMIQTSFCYSPMLGKILEFDKALRYLKIPLLFLVNNFAMNQKEKKSCSIQVYVMFYASDTT